MFLPLTRNLNWSGEGEGDGNSLGDGEYDVSKMDISPHQRPGSSQPGNKTKKKGKGKESYEENIAAWAHAWVEKQDRAISSQESQQFGPVFNSLKKIVIGRFRFTTSYERP